ncbi:MAG: polyprenyl synthetase family protein [Phycisphaerae bacterium]|jgi:geranylgeranyl pyrophosphate synthase
MVEKNEKINIKSELERNALLVSDTVAAILKDFKGIPANLNESIEYTLSASGKKVRAAVVLWSCNAINDEITADARIAAAAVEMLHTYSLIHDDLPAMDDDDYRRGKPSCHKAFDEATAILTGDALLTMAFEVLATKISSAERAIEMIKSLAQAAGPCGMIAGQVKDIASENGLGSGIDVQDIHINKTAKMFWASAVLGAIAADATKEQINLLGRFGLELGLGFQIADDILDVSSSSEQLGKTAGKDLKQGKLTYPAVFGIEQSKKKAQLSAMKAADNLRAFGSKATLLNELVFELLNRTK